MMFLDEVFLYSFRSEIRTIKLKRGINIILGENNTGKTALSKIIEYCLGSNDPGLPTGTILEKVQWFGLRVKIGDEYIFIARHNYIDGKTSIKAFIQYSKDVPERIVHNINIQNIVYILSAKLNIPLNSIIPPTLFLESKKASIKHALFFCFQNENEITNKDSLFHRETEPFIDKVIKAVLPFFLDPDLKDAIQLDHKRIEILGDIRKIAAKRDFYNYLLIQEKRVAGSLISEAIEAGLSNIRPPENKIREYFENMREITELIKFSGSDTISDLQNEVIQLRTKLSNLTIELDGLREHDSQYRTYYETLKDQKNRLVSINLFNQVNSNICPFCDNTIRQDSLPNLYIQENLIKLERQLGKIKKRDPSISEHNEQLLEKISNLKQEIIIKSNTLYSLMNEKEPEIIKQSRIRGKIDLWLFNHKSIYDYEISNLDNEEDTLKAELESINSNETKDMDDTLLRIVNEINYTLQFQNKRLSELIYIEYEHSHLLFDIQNITILFNTNNQLVRFSQIGSAKNHLIYHLMIHLSLHQYFLNHSCPVPNFLVLDHPSRGFSGDNAEGDYDKALSFLIDYIKKNMKDFQLIVLDGANLDEKFRDHIVDKWDKQNGLVPLTW